MAGREKEEIVIKESDYITHSKERSLKKSILEGSLHETGLGASSSLITPFALALGANGFHIGILSAVSSLFSPLGQLHGSKLMERHSRKKILVRSKGFQILLWLPLIFLAYLSWKNYIPLYLPYLLIASYSLLVYVSGTGHVAWFSWMGDLVKPEERGKYFSRRNRIIGIIGLSSFIISAFVLDYFKSKGLVLIGFSVLFFISLVFRESSRRITLRIFNPELKIKKGYYFSFFDFIKRYDNFGKFAFFNASFSLAIMIASPFFAVYMLRDLGFSYVTFTAVSLSSTVFYLLFTPIAGKFSDVYGNVKLLYVAGVLFPLVPIFWMFLENPWALIFLPGLTAGIANSAFVLAVTNFTYDSVKPQKRGLCVAYSSLLSGIGIFIGSFFGGLMVEHLNIGFVKPIIFVFLVSSLVRAGVALFYLPQIKEERNTEKIEGLSLNVIHPFKTVHSDVIWFKNFIHRK